MTVEAVPTTQLSQVIAQATAPSFLFGAASGFVAVLIGWIRIINTIAEGDAVRRRLDLKRVRWDGKEALTPGKHTLEFDFTYDGLGAGTLAFNNLSGIGRSATGVLKVDGKEVARQTMERTIPLILQWDENFDVGADTLTGVDDRDYQPPFAFNGTIDRLTIKIDRPQLTAEDIKKLQAAAPGVSNKSSE